MNNKPSVMGTDGEGLFYYVEMPLYSVFTHNLPYRTHSQPKMQSNPKIEHVHGTSVVMRELAKNIRHLLGIK